MESRQKTKSLENKSLYQSEWQAYVDRTLIISVARYLYLPLILNRVCSNAEVCDRLEARDLCRENARQARGISVSMWSAMAKTKGLWK